jgi:hypothetical protein
MYASNTIPRQYDGANIIGALDTLRFDAIAEAADLAGDFAGAVAEAAERGERLKVRAYAGLLSRAVRNLLITTAELGGAAEAQTQS